MSHPPAASSEQKPSLSEACTDLVRERRSRTADADDVAQEACVRAMQLPEPRMIRDPVRYLMRIARNLVVDRRRSKVREAALINSLAVVELHAGAAPDPERVLAGKQELKRVLAAIGCLPPRCREAFVLHRFNGLSYAAVARRMGVSTSMVEKHIAEAMLRITKASREENAS